MNLGGQGFDGREAPLFPEAGYKFHPQVLIVEIAVKVQQMDFQGKLPVFEGGAGADIGRGLTG